MWLKKDNENSSKPARQTYSRCWLFFVSICSFQVIAVSSAFDGRALVSNTLYASQSSKLTLSRSSEEERSLNNDDEKITIVRPHRIRQKRCRPTRRRPDYYWSDPNNLQLELRTFWTDRGVKLPKNKPPPIPNEVILRYYERHDLRAALVKYGGREAVSQVLGGSMIVPGRWRDALNESPELLTLVKADATLSTKSPPSLTAVRSTTRIDEASRWKHNNDRKPKGYWNKKTLLKEMYVYSSIFADLCCCRFETVFDSWPNVHFFLDTS